jgi:UDP-N-acetyl-D-mannosaminuronate dehydrogenase
MLNFREIDNPKFLIIGLAFKGMPETSDLRGSLAPKIISEIHNLYPQSQIFTWDPVVKTYFYTGTEKIISLTDILPIVDVVIIQNNNLTNFEEFKKVAPLHLNSKAIIYDFWDLVKPKMFSPTIQILTLGKGN